MLVAFSKDDDSREAFDVLQNTLSKDGVQIERNVGDPGGNVDAKVTWHAEAGIWSLLDAEYLPTRFWCCCGVQNPNEVKSLDIAVEINQRREGTDLLVGGAFARDGDRRVHLCHNGKIGGGKRRVGRTAFFEHYGGELKKMTYGSKIADVVDLGFISSPELIESLGRFAREIVRIKKKVAKG